MRVKRTWMRKFHTWVKENKIFYPIIKPTLGNVHDKLEIFKTNKR